MNREVYNTAFFVGLFVTLACWLALNIVSYHLAWQAQKDNPISFSGGSGPIFDWGVPFYWTNAGGYVANTLIVIGSSILIGHLVRITSDQSARDGDE